MDDQYSNKKNVFLDLRFKRVIDKIDLYLKFGEVKKKFDDCEEGKQVLYTIIDSLLIDVYGIGEYLQIKNVPNVNNPFFIGCRMFDTLKHYDRTFQISEKRSKIEEFELCHQQKTRLDNIKKNILSFKCKNDKISDDDFVDIYERFQIPMEMGIFLNENNLFFKEAGKISLMFGNSIKSFFNGLKSIDIKNINTDHLFNDFLNSKFNNGKINECGDICEKIKQSFISLKINKI